MARIQQPSASPPSPPLLLLTATLILCVVYGGIWSLKRPRRPPPPPPQWPLNPAPREDPHWAAAHNRLAAEVAAHQKDGGLDLILYGDSITECFRDTQFGFAEKQHCAGHTQAWAQSLAGKWAAALAIAGDESSHLLWRLQNGEGPRGLKPKAITMLIGTNDAGARLEASTHRDMGNTTAIGQMVASWVLQCAKEMQAQAPKATLFVLGILPKNTMPNDTAVVQAANSAIQQGVASQRSRQLRYIDCGPPFLRADGTLNVELVPDRLHPEGEGAKLLLQCILQQIRAAGIKL